jgi:hypothetical protein
VRPAPADVVQGREGGRWGFRWARGRGSAAATWGERPAAALTPSRRGGYLARNPQPKDEAMKTTRALTIIALAALAFAASDQSGFA